MIFSEVESSDDGHFSTINYPDENSLITSKRPTLGRSDAKRLHRKLKKYQIGEATDDVRLCIMCLRAIMNNQVKFFLSQPRFPSMDAVFVVRMVLTLLFNIP